MAKQDRKPKPTLGVVPRDIWKQQQIELRYNDLRRAIWERIEADQPIDPRWLDELSELEQDYIDESAMDDAEGHD